MPALVVMLVNCLRRRRSLVLYRHGLPGHPVMHAHFSNKSGKANSCKLLLHGVGVGDRLLGFGLEPAQALPSITTRKSGMEGEVRDAGLISDRPTSLLLQANRWTVKIRSKTKKMTVNYGRRRPPSWGPTCGTRHRPTIPISRYRKSVIATLIPIACCVLCASLTSFLVAAARTRY